MKSKKFMKILAIDTATEACSVALNNGTEQFQEFEICPQQHSQRLLPMVDSVLKQAKMRKPCYLVRAHSGKG